MLAPAFTLWHIRSSDDHVRRALTEGLRVHPITAAVLVARGTPSSHQASVLFKVRSTQVMDITPHGSQGPVLTILGTREFVGMKHVDVAGRLGINTWNGTEGMQLRIKDERPSRCEDVGSC